MVTAITGVGIVGLMALAVGYFSLYPQWKSRKTLTTYSTRTRPKSLLFDKRYGLCYIESGEILNDNSFKLELFSSNGQTYYPRYYNNEIVTYSEFNNLVGSGSPLYITKKDFNEMEGKKDNNFNVITDLKNQLVQTRAKSKILVSDPDERTDKLINWLTQLEVSRKSRVEQK